jgi:hypothetical protein
VPQLRPTVSDNPRVEVIVPISFKGDSRRWRTTAVVCVDPAQLDPSFVGRVIDDEFLEELPPHVDSCGENGEFHTFVFDGPMFKNAVKFSFGEVVCRDSFWFCDLLPAE